MINDEIIINGEGFQLENRRYTLLYIAHSLKCHLNQGKWVTFFLKNIVIKKIIYEHLQVIFYTFRYILNKPPPPPKKKKMNTRLAFSIFKYLIDKMKHEKGKN